MNINKYALTALAGSILGITLVGCLGFAGAEDEIDPVKETGVIEVQPAEAEKELPACPTEDSENCYWDAQTMGNEQGEDVVTITDDPVQPVEMPYEGQWDEVPEGTLICGKDAAPALDYNEVWGWWAYCEPAMVNEDGTLWEGR